MSSFEEYGAFNKQTKCTETFIAICKNQRPTSACTESDQALHCPLTKSLVDMNEFPK